MYPGNFGVVGSSLSLVSWMVAMLGCSRWCFELHLPQTFQLSNLNALEKESKSREIWASFYAILNKHFRRNLGQEFVSIFLWGNSRQRLQTKLVWCMLLYLYICNKNNAFIYINYTIWNIQLYIAELSILDSLSIFNYIYNCKSFSFGTYFRVIKLKKNWKITGISKYFYFCNLTGKKWDRI